MKVYVVSRGCYSSRSVVGVYVTPELAMEDNPLRVRVPDDYVAKASNLSRPGGWQRSEHTYEWEGVQYVSISWSNGLDWDDAVEIEEYELVEELSGS